jgi:putative flavoprotein involved in K+ transport
MPMLLDSLVIGAGQAGLAAGYQLQRSQLRFTLLEAASQPGGSWPHYYESLKLFSPARFSSLPGLPFPGDPKRYPARDEVIAYLRQYAAHFRLPIETSTAVESVTHAGGIFTAQTTDGRRYQARSLIAASGSFGRPYTPQIAGQELFEGQQLHSFAYRAPEPFAGQRVVVVGGGNSAVQIAAELASTAHVSLATREPVRFVTQRPLGRDVHFWWWLLRLDTSPVNNLRGWLFARLTEGSGSRVLDGGRYQAALAAGAPDVRPMFTKFSARGVRWADGSSESVDAVIFATGYRPNFAYLAPLGALDQDGQALQRYGLSTVIPGLGFVGLANQRTFASAALRGVGPDAHAVVRAIRQQLGVRRPGWPTSSLSQICCPARVS